ncbi:uncharacterized protein LOC125061853 [Pieris napi]|uniref:uncharacterized protein LOC125061853 n=1 Tax=Pieris napi TaxID=78633 RepID=UPI001FBBCDE0|nr:uncharacterized protein LOC125061853 [Pieris napi]
MSRRSAYGARLDYSPPPPTNCAKFLYYTWRLCSVVFSHFVMISLVVAYCILGAVTFERLESQHEREVKKNISQIRANTTYSIWQMTNRVSYLSQSNWTSDVLDMLKEFENAILLEMKVRGWDGSESPDRLQWTFTGALFYSIVVITTIGYGHIAPKTQSGKVVTIFYAILGIPLMLLCLSNIGDVMASFFRFLYWRVCCYVCTRPPKERPRHRRRTARGSMRRRPVERSNSDSGPRAHAPLRLNRPQPPRLHDDDGEFPKISLPLQDLQAALNDLDKYQKRACEGEVSYRSGRGDGSRSHWREFGRDLDSPDLPDLPDLPGPPHVARCDRGRSEYFSRDRDEYPNDRLRERRARSAFYEYERRAGSPSRRGATSVQRAESPGHRRLRRLQTLDDSRAPRYYSPSPDRDEWSDEGPTLRLPRSGWGSRQSDLVSAREETKPVPIWLCVLLVSSYIVAGTFLFKRWEGWAYLDAAYFCFITLTTIGFGDFVPAQGAAASASAASDAVHSIALCSLYLLFGIALLAMSFNLVQEQVRANVAALATRLGIIKPRDTDY